MNIRLNNVVFVKKDKTLYSNPHKTIMEESKTGYVYIDNVEGVAIIPFRHGANGREILIRDEYTPLHTTVLSIITGRKDPDDKDWRATARRELLEEAGILVEERWFSDVGEILPAGSYKRADIMCVVDVTGVHQGKPTTDGSLFEKKSTNMWIPVSELSRMVREPNGVPDAYFLAAITKFLMWCGMLNKSEESDLEKGKKGSEKPGHKYIRRKPKKSGKPGYDYIYQEPKAKGPKKADDKKGKGGIMEQLASLLGKKQGGEEEKKPKKQFPWDEFNNVPLDMPDFRKGMTAAQWTAELDRMVNSTISGLMADLDDADYDLMNDGDKINSLYVDAGIKMLESSQNQYSAQKTHYEDILVENKKLDDNAQREVRKAVIKMSQSLCMVNHMKSILDSSIFENVFDNFSGKMKSDKWNDSRDSKKLDKLSTAIAVIKNNLEYINDMMLDTKWLQGSDPKVDWMTDQVYEAVDGLMKSRNRFVKNGLKFFINEMTPVVESLADAEEITKALKLHEQFEIFINEVVYSSTTARRLGVFANQWNLKQRGIYEGASRFSAYVSGKIVDKIRSLQNLGDDDIISNYIEQTASNDAYAFLSMSYSQEPFRISEQIFTYIDMHGMDKYYQDMVFLTGGRKPLKTKASPEYEKEARFSEHYSDIVATLTKAYNGEDVYNDDDALYQSEKWAGGIGNMKKGKLSAAYTAMNTILLLNKRAPMSSKMPAFVRMWSSASHNSLMSNAIEEFVEAKGIDRGTYVNYHIASNRTIIPKRKDVKEALNDTILSIYRNTQAEFTQEPNPFKPIRLYRGNGEAEVKSVTSSWTTSDFIATNFGPVVSMVDIPKEAVLLFNNGSNEDYWTYPAEKEHVLVPGLLSPDKRPNPEVLAPEQRQNILDKELEKDAELYSEDY